MINTPIWLSLLLMIPVVFATSLVSSFMRYGNFGTAIKKTFIYSIYINLGIIAISIISLCIHYLFGGGVIWH